MVRFFNLLLILLVASCAIFDRDTHKKYLESLNNQQFDEALKIAKSDKFYKDEESRLLKYLELGLLHFYEKNYYQALEHFNKAKDLSDRLFTVSISKKVTKAFINDNVDNYYGQRYERSLIRFYQSLTHFTLFTVGEYEEYEIIDLISKKTTVVKKQILDDAKKRFHHVASKNILIEWNSLLESYKSQLSGEVTFKDDLLAKIYGAIIHETFNNSTDDQIAKKLYESAKDLIYKNYNLYPTFNEKSASFKNDFSKLHKMPKKKVDDEYISATEVQKNLIDYIDARLTNLKKKDNEKENIFFLLQRGLIPSKAVSKSEFPLPITILPSGVNNKDDFIKFSLTTMGLAATSRPVIYFEVPELNPRPVLVGDTIIIEDTNKGEKKEVTLSVINPLADMAKLELEQELTTIKVRTGARVAAKHLSALASAYFIYKKALANGEFVAYALSAGSYALANKAIQESEKADIRNWAALPDNFQMSSLKLNKGEYLIYLKGTQEPKEKIIIDNSNHFKFLVLKK